MKNAGFLTGQEKERKTKDGREIIEDIMMARFRVRWALV
jgi:hypothetical protein